MTTDKLIVTPEPCGCRKCLDSLPPDGGFVPRSGRFMTVCSICGNKRCPHAHDHRYKCTGSNETGQVPQLSDAGLDEAVDGMIARAVRVPEAPPSPAGQQRLEDIEAALARDEGN